MTVIKKIISVYRYIYFRLYLYHTKKWEGDNKLGQFNSNFAITGSALCLFFSIDLIVKRVFHIDGIFNNNYKIIGLVITVIVIHTYLFSIDENDLEKKYAKRNESDLSWRLKGYLSLLFVFGPVILLILLM